MKPQKGVYTYRSTKVSSMAIVIGYDFGLLHCWRTSKVVSATELQYHLDIISSRPSSFYVQALNQVVL